MRVSLKTWFLSIVLSLVLAAPALAQKFDWQQAKGTQLRVLLNKHPWQGAIEPHLKEFETLTGIKLVAEVYPEDQFRAKVLVELTSGASSIDVFMSMPAQEGLKYVRAGWLQPVDEFLKNPALTAPDYNWNDFLEKTREAMVIEGKAMTDDGQAGYGIVARGKRAAATSQFAAYLHAMGSTWLAPNREPIFNNEDGIKALDLYGRLLRLYGPPGSENNHWYEASSIFSQGKAAMYTDANSLFPVIEDAQKSKVVGKVGYALFPRGPKGQYGSTVAAWGLAMPKTSQNQKAAWLFMQWATAKEQVLAVQSEKGVLGARESVWKEPKGMAKVPAALRESLTVGSKVGNPLWNPPVVAVAECRDAIGAAIVVSIQGGDVRAADNKAATDVKRIMLETEKK